GGILAVVVVQLGRLVGAHREWLAARIEDEIGRPIAFGDLRVSLRGGPGVRITDVRIPDDPSYGGGDLLHASEVWVTVRLWPALFGRYEIGRIVLTAPVLTIIRDRRGFNLETLGRKGRREREPGRARRAEERAGFPVLVIGLIDLHDGVVRYADRRVEPGRELVLERVDIAGSDVRLERPITLVATAALAGSAPAKIELTGSIGPVGDPPGLDPIPLDLHLAIPKLDAASLPDGAAAPDLSLPA